MNDMAPGNPSPSHRRPQPSRAERPRHRGVAPLLDRDARVPSGRRSAAWSRRRPPRRHALLQRRARRQDPPPRHSTGRYAGSRAAATGRTRSAMLRSRCRTAKSWLRQLAFLQSRGVAFERRVEHGMTHSLYIRDPNGYSVELFVRAAARGVGERHQRGAQPLCGDANGRRRGAGRSGGVSGVREVGGGKLEADQEYDIDLTVGREPGARAARRRLSPHQSAIEGERGRGDRGLGQVAGPRAGEPHPSTCSSFRPWRPSASWRETIVEQRSEIER